MESAGLGIDESRVLDLIRRLQRVQSRIVSSATTLTAGDDLVLVDTSGGSVTITLPPAQQHPNKKFEVKKTSASNTLTVQRSGSDLIDGASTKAWTTNNQVYGFVSAITTAPATWGWVVLHG